MTYFDEVMADSPLLYWALNEPATSGAATDSSGNARDGLYVNAPTVVAGLGSGTASLLNGGNQWITSTYNPFSTATSLTFEMWVVRDTNTTGDCMFGGSQPSTQPALNCNAGADTVTFFSSVGAAGQTWAGTVISTATPTHVVLRWNGAAKQSELFINKVSQGTKTHSTDFDATPGNFGVGKRSASSDAFDGTVDEVAIYSGLLSQARIDAHYAAASPGTPPPAGAWYATHELGTLSEWSVSGGGGEFNSGVADTVASTDFAHSGSWSAKQTADTTSGSAGTRMFRWQEYRNLVPGRPATTTCFIYIPATVTVGGFFNIFQFKSKTQDSAWIDVFWQVNLVNHGGGGGPLKLAVAWGCGAENPDFPVGPYEDSIPFDQCNFNLDPPSTHLLVPIASWFSITAEITPSSGYTGALKVWQDTTLLWDLTDTMTGYPNTNSINGVDTQWAVNAYCNGLTPATWTHYVDDASIIPGAASGETEGILVAPHSLGPR